MGNNNLQKKYSLRKFKGIGLASAVIGIFFANQSVYANVTANGKDETTIVSEFDKVPSRAKTTFTDDQNPTKKVTVDAVADIRYKKPTKANYNTGDADGTDSIKYHSEATVKYLLESDKSKLQDSKVVEGERATVTTPYDKKGIAYDTDGKDYRESSVEKTGEAVTENSGKEEKIKANDKEYTLVRSEVVGKDKATYEKTKFNDIEAPVSPEKMHNNLGEINYEKITGKVYLVEETSDGKYGKFVEASNIKSDAEAVEAWKNGQATAKNFTKENVTLQKGDTILVLDRDTYAHGSGKRTVNTINYRREKVTAAPEYNRVVSSEEIRDVNAYPSYALSDGSVSGKYLTAHKDAVDEHYSDWAKDYPEVETREDSIYVNKGVVTISDDLSKIKVVNADSTTNETEFTKKEVTTKVETDYVVEELITPVRAYKVMDEGSPVVNHYYRMHITRESKAYGMVGLAVVRIKYLTTEDREIKPEVIRILGDGYELNVYNQYSGNTKVGERRDEKIYERFYDATSEKYETLKDERTGLTYEYVGLKQASSAASGKVVGAGMTEVIYEYRLVSEEEKTPSSSVVTKTGSVDVKHVVINEDGMLKTLKETEVVKNNVPLEYEDTYVTYSKGVKVSERKKKRTVKEKYYTTDKQYSTLKDEATGLVYKYVGLTSDSAPAAGDVTEGEKHVIYSYTLDKQEETTPSKTVEAKGTVVVKYVDANGNEIKNAENVVTDAVVKTTKTYATKSGDVELSTRDEVTENNVNYNAAEKKVDTITKDGKKYKFYRVLPVDTKFNNVTEETGKVKEGTTTVVYQYDEIIPVNPNKPNDNTPNTPKTGDKVPNDPQNRTFEQLGVLKEVKRNITYVYENGPKAGQEAAAPVNQKARFTRTAEINSRTGEVVYTSEWTKAQKLAEVVSPEIAKYAVDRAKIDELSVTHESTDSNEVVKYRENPDIIEHDAAKDKKGTVIVKFVDEQGNEIAKSITVKGNVLVAKATTKVYADRDAETEYTATNEEYNTELTRQDTIEFNGKKYIYQRVLPVSATLGNSDKETGKVPEGTTTVIYQYAEEVDSFIPAFPPKEEVPEFNGKVDDAEKDKKGTVIVKYVDIKEIFLASDVVVKDNVVVAKAMTTITGDKSETTYTATGEEYAVVPPQTIEVDGVTFKLKSVLPASNKFNNTIEEKGLVKEGVTKVVYQYVMQIEAPEVEVPEFEGGVIPLDPPTVDKPEFEGGVIPLDPPKVDKPEFEGGVIPLDPPTVDKPEFEGGVVPLDPPKVEIPNPNPQPEPNPNPQPKPEEPKKEEPKKEEPKQNDSTPGNMNKVNETPSSVQENTLKELPNTGTGQEFAIFGAAASAILSGLGLLVPTKKEK